MVNVTKHLTLLLFIALAWGQDNLKKEYDFDKLVSKGGTIFLGEYSRIENSVVYFKTTNAMASQGVPLNKVHTLQLSDGTIIINNGEINEIDLNNRQDRKLIFKEDKELKPGEMLLLFVTPVALGYLLEFLFWI